jgi:hypothetical protein
VDERIFYSNQQGKKLLDSLLKGDQRLWVEVNWMNSIMP